MLGADFIKTPRFWLNVRRLDAIIWHRETVDVYLGGGGEPVSIPRQDFIDGVRLWHALHNASPGGPYPPPPAPGPRLSVVPAEEEDAG